MANLCYVYVGSVDTNLIIEFLLPTELAIENKSGSIPIQRRIFLFHFFLPAHRPVVDPSWASNIHFVAV